MLTDDWELKFKKKQRRLSLNRISQLSFIGHVTFSRGDVAARTRLSVHVLKVKSGNTSCAGRLQGMNSDESVGRPGP